MDSEGAKAARTALFMMVSPDFAAPLSGALCVAMLREANAAEPLF
jgi:hypothetical protein